MVQATCYRPRLSEYHYDLHTLVSGCCVDWGLQPLTYTAAAQQRAIYIVPVCINSHHNPQQKSNHPIQFVNMLFIQLLFFTLLAPVLSSVLPEAYSPASYSNPSDDLAIRQTACPAIWKEIATDLKAVFRGCNRPARTAIRFAFHDAAGYSSATPKYGAASGGADGSLLMNEDEIKRSDNDPMLGFRDGLLLPRYKKYKDRGVGAADFVQFAGVIGTASCPNGPVYKTVCICTKFLYE